MEKRRPRTVNERSLAAALALFLGVFVAIVAWFAFTATGAVAPPFVVVVPAIIGLALAGYVYLQAEVIVSVGRQEQYRCANCGRTWERRNRE